MRAGRFASAAAFVPLLKALDVLESQAVDPHAGGSREGSALLPG